MARMQEQDESSRQEMQESMEEETTHLQESSPQEKQSRATLPPEILAAVRRLNPIDDIFFTKIMEDPATAEEIISTILQVKVKVLSVVPQNTVMNLQGRGVRLDALASVELAAETELLEDSPIGPKGAKVNVEVQRANNDDHERRVRYNTAAVLLNSTSKGLERFADLPDVVSIFISAFDVIGNGRMMERIRRVDEDGREHHNGLTEIYVNTAVRDTSTPAKEDIAELMRIFVDSDAYDYQRFPCFSERKNQFKNLEGGKADMSEELEMLLEKEVQKRAAEAEKKSAEAEKKSKDLQVQIDSGILGMLEIGMDVPVIAKILHVSEGYVLSLRDRLPAA